MLLGFQMMEVDYQTYTSLNEESPYLIDAIDTINAIETEFLFLYIIHLKENGYIYRNNMDNIE